ncbi:MAG TPA: hypothetical protein VJ302_10210 [Blastocatellia bacterium]|nr:hypothetical protein [Blastocatellia bacterium]
MSIETKIFQPCSPNETRVFLILFCLTLAAQLIINFQDQLDYLRTDPERVYGRSSGLFGWYRGPSLSPRQFYLVAVALIVSLFGIAASLAPRFFLLIALICQFLYFNQIASLAYIQRKVNLVSIVLLIMLFSPGIDQPFDQLVPSWPMVLVKIALAQMYCSAGLQKLRRGGWQWCDGESLQTYLVEHYLWGDMKNALRLGRSLRLCRILSILVLIFELTFVLIIPFQNLACLYAIGGVIFHASTSAVMRIDYLKYLSPVYMVFIAEPVLRLLTFLKT